MPEPRLPEQYSTWVGSIYVFNLIVGTGALTLPYAFNQAGWLVSLLVIIALAYMSYITATFVIESMATANAVIQWRRCQHLPKVEYELPETCSLGDDTNQQDDNKSQDGNFSGSENSKEETPLLESENGERPTIPTDFYSIQERVEMGQMVSIFFHKIGIILFYCCICIYLYGDLAIYCAAVAKSLRDVSCTYVPDNYTCNQTTINIKERCWDSISISRQNAYRLYIGAFLLLLGPFVFFNVQKTKYLQMTTSLLRWIAFLTMIILAAIQLGKGKGQGHPSLGNIKGIPSLFGVCVYSFMCHHSLPSLVTPISNKQKIFTVFAADYIAILGFYLLLAFTGIFTFNSLHDLYTLDFQPDKCGTGEDSITDSAFIRYFLALFPVFTLSTNFPIIGITLRNNLQSMCLKENVDYSFFIRRILFPIITILPPVAIAIISESVEFLVGFTGSYAGTGIQYIVPAMLVYTSRKLAANTIGGGVKNTHSSPFRHRLWPAFVLVWAGSCIIIVTINNLLDIFGTSS